MTPKQTALLEVFKVIALSVAMGVVVGLLLDTFGIAKVAVGFGVILVAFGCKLLYDIELNRARILKELNANQK